MKISINVRMYSCSPKWLPAYSLDEALHRVAAIGYKGVEMTACSPHAWPDFLDNKRRKNINELLKKLNLEVSSFCPALGGGPGLNPASNDEVERKASAFYYKQCIDLAVDWGSPLVIYVAGWFMFGESRNTALENSLKTLKECAKYAQDKGIILVVEPTPADSNLIESAYDALDLMHRAGMKNVKVMFDTIHVIYRQEVLADYVRIMGEDLTHIHMVDAKRLPPGKGGYNFRPMIKALKEINYTGYLAQEIGFTRDTDPDAYAQQGYEYLTKLIDEVK